MNYFIYIDIKLKLQISSASSGWQYADDETNVLQVKYRSLSLVLSPESDRIALIH